MSNASTKMGRRLGFGSDPNVRNWCGVTSDLEMWLGISLPSVSCGNDSSKEVGKGGRGMEP